MRAEAANKCHIKISAFTWQSRVLVKSIYEAITSARSLGRSLYLATWGWWAFKGTPTHLVNKQHIANMNSNTLVRGFRDLYTKSPRDTCSNMAVIGWTGSTSKQLQAGSLIHYRPTGSFVLQNPELLVNWCLVTGSLGITTLYGKIGKLLYKLNKNHFLWLDHWCPGAVETHVTSPKAGTNFSWTKSGGHLSPWLL